MKKAEEVKNIQKSEIFDEKERGSSGISYDTIGTTLQALNVQLDEGESIYSESGKMSWMTKNIEMKTKGRGISKMFSRVFTGESLFVNEFKATNSTGVVTFSTDQAGKVIPIDLSHDKPTVTFQRGAFLCAEMGVDLSVALVRKFSAGLFGGKGFILQKVSGQGRAHLIADGEVVMYELKDGEEVLVDQGNLLAYESTVDFDIQTVGGGPFNWFFGGEGIFLGVLRGPGKVWLQTRKQNLTANMYSASARRSSNPIGAIVGILISIIAFCMFCLIPFIISLSSNN